MSDYILHTKSNGDLLINANLATPNANVIGQRKTYEFWFGDFGEDLNVEGTYTVANSTTETYGTVIVDAGATLTIEGTLQCNKVINNGTITVNGTISVSEGYVGTNRRDVLTSLGGFSGKYETSRMLDGTLKYTERIPSGELADSLVVGIEPSEDLKALDVNGVWGIIDSVADARGPTLNTNRIDLSITVLAEYEDYTDHSQMENNLKL